MHGEPGTAEDAMSRGLALLDSHDTSLASRWFDRARRLVPNDAAPLLLYATAISHTDKARADSLLTALIARFPLHGAARVALAAIKLAGNDVAGAVGVLRAFLAELPPPPDMAFLGLAERVAAVADFPGWAGVDEGGVVTWSTRQAGAVAVLLDGRRVRRTAPNGARSVKLPARWRDATTLTIRADGQDLLGSPFSLHARRHRRGKLTTAAARSENMPDGASQNTKYGCAVIIVTHAQGGGVARHVRMRCAVLRAQGFQPILIVPHGPFPPEPGAARLCAIADEISALPGLVFDPAVVDGLALFLQDYRPVAVEFHHMMGHDPALSKLASCFGIPYDIYIHDYALICPRVTLSGLQERYCGEPIDVGFCQACVTETGDRSYFGMDIATLRAWSRRFLTASRQVCVSSSEVAARIRRYVPAARISVTPWEDDSARRVFPPAPREFSAGLQVCVAGAIGLDKGYGVLLACAQDAERRGLGVFFTVVGSTIDDASLMRTGKAFVTGPYQEEEAENLVRAQNADIGFLPSVWPETWCYGLSLLWQAGLWPVAFDLGTPAARIKQNGCGQLLPLGLAAPRINDALFSCAMRRAA